MTTACTVWLTGLSGAGKTTTAHEVARMIRVLGQACVVIDGDEMRKGLSSDLGFSTADRNENVRRAGEVAALLNEQGVNVVVALISPVAKSRANVRRRHLDGGLKFVEIYLSTPLSVCEERDPKLLYKRARAGEQKNFTGVDDEYQAPESAELSISTAEKSVIDVATAILNVVSTTSPNPT